MTLLKKSGRDGRSLEVDGGGQMEGEGRGVCWTNGLSTRLGGCLEGGVQRRGSALGEWVWTRKDAGKRTRLSPAREKGRLESGRSEGAETLRREERVCVECYNPSGDWPRRGNRGTDSGQGNYRIKIRKVKRDRDGGGVRW